MSNEHLKSLRVLLEWLNKEGLLLESDHEIDPKCEMTAIQKLLDGGPPMLFHNVKGYPNARLATNVFGADIIGASMFGCKDRKELKFKIHEGILNPTAPVIVDEAPCQEVVIDKDVDVWPVIPMIQHTPKDPGRTLGAGKTVASMAYFLQSNEFSGRCSLEGQVNISNITGIAYRSNRHTVL
jgi:4-hydroxy-3-polyprenylbenzoate decarboxylase